MELGWYRGILSQTVTCHPVENSLLATTFRPRRVSSLCVMSLPTNGSCAILRIDMIDSIPVGNQPPAEIRFGNQFELFLDILIN
jgi:hypothetical protein